MTDIRIQQGTDSGFAWPLLTTAGQPFDLTGYTVKSQVRTNSGVLLHEWSTTAGNATIVSNVVYILWTATETQAWKWSTAKYDIKLISPQNKTKRLDSGAVLVSKGHTQ